ncbi:MAG: hypothetical protein K0R78_1700 [Pelosinus sp.]|nr:hypothetical protein [Pelosinus sp.]
MKIEFRHTTCCHFYNILILRLEYHEDLFHTGFKAKVKIQGVVFYLTLDPLLCTLFTHLAIAYTF